MGIAEASARMTEAWQQMVPPNSGLASYHGLDDSQFQQIKQCLAQGRQLPKELVNIPGMTSIACYLNALNAYLK